MSEKRLFIETDIPKKLLDHYLKQDVIAVDTELHGLTLNRDEICLIQICDDDSNVCLVKPDVENPPSNVKRLMEAENVLKVFHFALTDVAFFQTSLGITVAPFACTKVMSKLIRTYTGSHGLKDLTLEFLNIKIDKEQQQTDWSRNDLSTKQLKYAANDVYNLVEIYRHLDAMLVRRGSLKTGASMVELNKKAQAALPTIIELLINGYGDLDGGWQTSLFNH